MRMFRVEQALWNRRGQLMPVCAGSSTACPRTTERPWCSTTSRGKPPRRSPTSPGVRSPQPRFASTAHDGVSSRLSTRSAASIATRTTSFVVTVSPKSESPPPAAHSGLRPEEPTKRGRHAHPSRGSGRRIGSGRTEDHSHLSAGLTTFTRTTLTSRKKGASSWPTTLRQPKQRPQPHPKGSAGCWIPLAGACS